MDENYLIWLVKVIGPVVGSIIGFTIGFHLKEILFSLKNFLKI